MKKILFGFIYAIICIVATQAQTLYSTTHLGGNEGAGAINKFIPATNNLTVAKSFEDLASHPAYTNLIEASDGKLYGMAPQGGERGNGVIFSFDPVTSSYTRLKDFNTNLGGINPEGSLMQASNGKLYGMTYSGGSSGFYGVIFSFDPSTSTYTKLKDFSEEDGGNPYGSLIQAKDGKLYGMTSNGGNNAAGVIFSFDPSTLIYKKLKDFTNTDGANPYGSLIQASDGKLYGMTKDGGNKGAGVIFSFDISSSTYVNRKNFVSADGANPFGDLTQAKDGKLYGVTHGGGTDGAGVIFSFDPFSSDYTKLKDFDSLNGSKPVGSLIKASDGKLYGMTNGGGNSDVGVIFSFDPSSSGYTKIKDFDVANGGNPYGSLLQASNKKLYGMTADGGSIGVGVIFSFDPSAAVYAKLRDFDNTKGAYPYGSLIRATDGKLYGMTYVGGSNGGGIIYSFDPSSFTYKKLKDFNNFDGVHPYGTLVQARNGKLYGTTVDGGQGDLGVIFSFDPSSSIYTKLKNFDSDSGAYPTGSMIQANDGKLYGITSQGGSNNAGVIFSFDPASSTFVNLHNFDNTNGTSPFGDLLQASDGKLYGMTWRGGSSNGGVIFSFDPASLVFSNLHNFDDGNGSHPRGSILQAKDGKLYGLTFAGGSSDLGVIFSYDPLASTYTKLKDFDSTNGGNPYGSLIQASDGKLYGMTANGGSSNLGVIFSYDPSSSTYNKLKDYNGANGANPSYGAAFIEVNDSTATLPTVSITTPADSAVYIVGNYIKVNATATDADGTITKVEFYNDSNLLHTETVVPYGYQLKHLPAGSYTITAKAYDNSGNVATSAPVHITVVENQAPVVSITTPANNAVYTVGNYIKVNATAADSDGTISKVEFYSDSTLLHTEYLIPYGHHLKHLPAGTHTFTVKAYDNLGLSATSAPVTITVLDSAPIVSSRPYLQNGKTVLKDALTLRAFPNPATETLNLQTQGLQLNKPANISLISNTGIVLENIQISNAAQTTQLDVLLLAKGVYTIKIISGDKILNKQLVKL